MVLNNLKEQWAIRMEYCEFAISEEKIKNEDLWIPFQKQRYVETWRISKINSKKLEAFDTDVFRRALWLSGRQRTRNEDMINDWASANNWSVMRRCKECKITLSKSVLQWIPSKLQKTWKIKKDLEKGNYKIVHYIQLFGITSLVLSPWKHQVVQVFHHKIDNLEFFTFIH